MANYNMGSSGMTINGVPITGNNAYAGWWGNDIWYVDDIVGVDTNTGKETLSAFKTIQKAVDKAGANDTIYLRPRDMGTGRYHEHGYYSGTIATTTTQAGLSIIGTSGGNGTIGQNIRCMIEPTAADTAAVVQVNSPCISLENLGVKQIDESVSGGAINATSTYGTVQAWGLSVHNCFFKDFQSAGAVQATIQVDTAHWSTIQHSVFRECDLAINGRSTEASLRGLTIRYNTFMGEAADVDCCVRMGDCESLHIQKCSFLMAKPTRGSMDAYLQFVGATDSGMAEDCYFAHASKTIADFVSGIAGEFLLVNCKGKDEEIIAT